MRLAPNHISIADHRALNAVYGHGTGTMKSEYYDGEPFPVPLLHACLTYASAFVPPRPAVRGVFNTRDRQEHSRKRRIVAHSFAPKSIISFEEFIRREVALLLERWDEFCDKAKKEGTKVSAVRVGARVRADESRRARAVWSDTLGSTVCSGSTTLLL